MRYGDVTTEARSAPSARSIGIIPTYRLVDTCAAEFEAYTPYYYSTYGDENERRDSGKKKIIILGGGPNRIGQGIEFDYCCVHAAFALREEGFETIMVNSNPETVSTDYDTSDKLYFEPLTLEDVLNICEQESENLFGVIVQFGGQTPLNLAAGLQAAGVPIIGTSPKSIEIAEDRKLFGAMLDKLGIRQTAGGTASTEERSRHRRERSRLPRARAPELRPRRTRHAARPQRNRPAPLRARSRRSQPRRDARHRGESDPRRSLPRRRHRGGCGLHQRRRDRRHRRDHGAHRRSRHPQRRQRLRHPALFAQATK